MFRTHRQGIHSRIKQTLNILSPLVRSRSVVYSSVCQFVIDGRCISALQIVKFLSYKNILKL